MRKPKIGLLPLYIELYDRTTGTSYVSDVGSEQGRLKYRDYGYVSTFAGPGGNQFVILAGTRDIAVMRTAEVATQESTLRELRLQRARLAIEQSQRLHIGAIAWRCGFTHASDFSKLFKTRFGFSPTDWHRYTRESRLG